MGLSHSHIYASFIGEEDTVSIKHIPFDPHVMMEIEKEIGRQYEELDKYEDCSFDGRYKVDPKQKLTIEGYSDPDQTFSKIASALNGEDGEILKSADELKKAAGLFFYLKKYPNLIIFQSFANRYVIDKKKAFQKLRGRDVYSHMDDSPFTLGTSVTGYFDSSTKVLTLKSVFSGRRVLPGFAQNYIPGATQEEVVNFFKNSIFDQRSAQNISVESKKIGRLVWLINSSKEKLENRLEDIKDITSALNLPCISPEGKIELFKEVKKTEIILQVIAKDIFRQGEQIVLTNSKRVLKPFES